MGWLRGRPRGVPLRSCPLRPWGHCHTWMWLTTPHCWSAPKHPAIPALPSWTGKPARFADLAPPHPRHSGRRPCQSGRLGPGDPPNPARTATSPPESTMATSGHAGPKLAPWCGACLTGTANRRTRHEHGPPHHKGRRSRLGRRPRRPHRRPPRNRGSPPPQLAA